MIRRDDSAFRSSAPRQLRAARRQRAFAHYHPQRQAAQIGVGQLDPGAQPAAVVVEHLDAGGRQLREQALGGLPGLRLAGQRDQGNLIRGDRHRQRQTARVVMLLGHARQQPLQADAVSPHHDGVGGARRVGEARLLGLRITGTELAQDAHRDPAGESQRGAAGGARRAVEGGGNQAHHRRLVVSPAAHVAQVVAGPVGAHHQVGALRHPAIDHEHRLPRLDAYRRSEARHHAGSGDLIRVRRPQLSHSGQFLHLNRIRLQVAAHDRGYHGNLRRARAGIRLRDGPNGRFRCSGPRPGPHPSGACRGVEHHLRRLLRGDSQKRRQLVDGGGARRGHLLQRRGLSGRRLQREAGGLAPGGVAALRAQRDTVLAARGQVRELVGRGGAARAAVAAHRLQRHSGAPGDAPERLVVSAVLALQPGLIAVQGVGVVPAELAQPKQAAARAQLVPELGPHLEHQRGELPVGGDFRGGVECQRRLVGRRQHQVTLAAVAKARRSRVEFRPAARGLPQLRRLDQRQRQLLAADPLQLLAHDLLELA